ncbi:MAG: DUF2141 domain-containing protein [Azonexus sp.]|nr:DUF2141 domain-containing protein [Azonexus sp.]
MKKSPAFGFSLRRLLLGVLVGCLFGAISAQADESRLIVTLKDVRDSTGQIRASIYREPETFRKEDRAVAVVSVPAQKGDLKLAFMALPLGRYAIMAYHDADSDSKLGLRFGMFPTEGYGLSNNPKVIGPPKFADSAFDLTGPETSIEIKLSY